MYISRDYKLGSENNNIRQSKYNAGVAQLYRLDFLWQKVHEHKCAGQLSAWNWRLDAVWGELGADADEPHETKFYDFMKKIAKCKKNKSLLYQTLIKKEIFLRKLQNTQGKGSAYQQNDDDYLSS